MTEKVSKQDKQIVLLIGIVILAALLWNTPLLYPIKMFTVLLHEVSHGIAAILTGGRITRIDITPDLGGVCYFVIPPGFLRSSFAASAGYLGSILWGCILLFLSHKFRCSKLLLSIIAAVIFFITILYVRAPFGLIFCILFSLALWFLSVKLKYEVTEFILRFMATTSCLYALIDISEDLVTRTVVGSDSYQIASMIGIPALSVPIGIFWILLSAIACFFTLYVTFAEPKKKKSSNNRVVS